MKSGLPVVKVLALSAAGMLALVVDGAATGGPVSTARPPSLCAASEEVVFGCAQDHKLVSLCASAIGRGATQLRYVYGTKDKVELEVSQATRPDAFSSGGAGLSGGGVDFVRVRNGGFAYVIYTGMTPGWSQDGWIVEAGGSPISHHICRREATGKNVWGPVYAAKLRRASDDLRFRPPDWVGAAPPKPAH
jgi:hypothetical protein